MTAKADTNPLREALEAVKRWANSECPCENEKPDPCPLCGARASHDVCKAFEGMFPASLAGQIDAALASEPVAGTVRKELECANCGAKTAFPLCDDCAVSPGVPKPPAATVTPHERGSDAAEADRYFDMASEFGNRMQKAEARVAVLDKAMREAINLLAERTQGSPARSAGHNARLKLERVLSTSPATPPAPGAADRAKGAMDFCEWLQGYFEGGTPGRDDLDAFEANQIRAELNERFVNGSEVTRADRSAVTPSAPGVSAPAQPLPEQSPSGPRPPGERP